MNKADYFARDTVANIALCLGTPPWLHRKENPAFLFWRSWIQYLPVPNSESSLASNTHSIVTDYHALLERSAPAPSAR